MKKIKRGDLVGRLSYGKDIIFVVERIIKTANHEEFAILKGLTVRIQADSKVEDLEPIETRTAYESQKKLEERIENRIKEYQKSIQNFNFRDNTVIHTGRILHIDGDKKYSEKSSHYYRKLGLNAIVRNIPERRQVDNIKTLLLRFDPDILVITGHDGMIKKGRNFNDLYNYRNSRYFMQSVEEARKWQNQKKDLVIFAGACQSYYEGLMIAGANFASSPARILIDFMDPLVVAEKIALTNSNHFVTIHEIEGELRDGQRGVSGIGGQGKKEIILM